MAYIPLKGTTFKRKTMLLNKIDFIPREYANLAFEYDDPLPRRNVSRTEDSDGEGHKLHPNINSSSESLSEKEIAGNTKKSSFNNTVRNSQDNTPREKDGKIYI